MIFKTSKLSSLRARLTLRYAFALALIACVLATSYFIVSKQINANEKDAYLVNLSGMQRMLSQRIALMSREIYHADTKKEADLYFVKMQLVRRRMFNNHEQLISGDLGVNGTYTLSPRIYEMYFREGGVDERVKSYLEIANEYLRLYEAQGLEGVRDSDLMSRIVTIARNGLLSELNDVVSQYEWEARAKIGKFRQLEMIVLSLGFLTLLIEVIFIFKPMVNSVTRSVNKLEVANAELIEFSYRISHDLRAPVVSTLGLTDVMSGAIKDGNKDLAQTALGHVKKSMVQLDTLISDVINLTKMKMSNVEKEEVDLKALVDQVVEKLSHLPGFDDVVIERNIDVHEPVKIKRIFVLQTLENLVSNAVKYSDPEEKRSVVRIGAQIRQGKCVLSVEDNGIGIPEKFYSEVFKMFKRFSPKHSFGSGLGLYLVSQNAKSLDGDIKLISLEKGVKFQLSFPV